MKEHTKPVHIEERSLSVIMLILKKVQCENNFSKHHESVHTKDRSHNCSNREFSSSRRDILERHVNHFLNPNPTRQG